MNKDDIRDLKDLTNAVITISETVNDISVCLRGDPKNHKDEGLVGAVNNNVKWKDKITKSIGGLGLGFLALMIKEGFNHFKSGS